MGEVEDNPGGTATRGDVRLNGSNAAESCHGSPKSPRSASPREEPTDEANLIHSRNNGCLHGLTSAEPWKMMRR